MEAKSKSTTSFLFARFSFGFSFLFLSSVVRFAFFYPMIFASLYYSLQLSESIHYTQPTYTNKYRQTDSKSKRVRVYVANASNQFSRNDKHNYCSRNCRALLPRRLKCTGKRTTILEEVGNLL